MTGTSYNGTHSAGRRNDRRGRSRSDHSRSRRIPPTTITTGRTDWSVPSRRLTWVRTLTSFTTSSTAAIQSGATHCDCNGPRRERWPRDSIGIDRGLQRVLGGARLPQRPGPLEGPHVDGACFQRLERHARAQRANLSSAQSQRRARAGLLSSGRTRGGAAESSMMNRWFTRYLHAAVKNGVEEGTSGVDRSRERRQRRKPTPYDDYPNPAASSWSRCIFHRR